MPKATNVKNIVYHCSAGFSLIPAIERFWKSKGWKSKGYHVIIYLDGTIWYLDANGNYTTDESKVDFSKITNGVLGFNDSTIHICCIGGIDRATGKGKDTRTDAQKKSIDYATQLAINWLKKNGKDVTKNFGIVGHYDYAKDTNNSGVIETWERNKECPSWDVINSDVHYLYSSKDRYGKLPTQK
jgi:N-acetylmuramoyl-L-alanine amidase